MRRRIDRTALLGIWLALAAGCGDPPLVESIQRGEAKVSKKLLAHGADVNARGRDGSTALHAAIVSQDRELYLQLLARGADPNICDDKGTSVVHLAAEQDDVFWLREALKHGGNPNQPNTGNRYSPDSTPIFYACNARKPDNVLELMSAGADLNHMNWMGTRPLRAAMENRLWDIALQMIEAGADPRLPGKKAGSILDCCGWFDEGYVIHGLMGYDSDDRQGYLRLRKFLIENGYLERN